eukprot:TRINITY_DN49048_c0_g1_i1.p1 TRINITY_DN49048_c0_g1~~TRINITY_DN49048_c0_g1_i1.p1  ORF type:complete len:353 (+),score=67.58 TRINITY_DN49048_c0_g1_i1:27-1061(+)
MAGGSLPQQQSSQSAINVRAKAVEGQLEDSAATWHDIFSTISAAREKADKEALDEMHRRRTRTEKPCKRLAGKLSTALAVAAARNRLAEASRAAAEAKKAKKALEPSPPSSPKQGLRPRPASAPSTGRRPVSALPSRPVSGSSSRRHLSAAKTARQVSAPSSRPKSASTSRPTGAATARTQRPQSARVASPSPRSGTRQCDSFKPAVGNGGYFDPTKGFLPNNNFNTWDRNRCALLERAWPKEGAVATLYDRQRKDKVEWKRGHPVGTIFGMALADVAASPAADQDIEMALKRHDQAKERIERQEASEKLRKHHEGQLALHAEGFGTKNTTVQWLNGRPVYLEF